MRRSFCNHQWRLSKQLTISWVTLQGPGFLVVSCDIIVVRAPHLVEIGPIWITSARDFRSTAAQRELAIGQQVATIMEWVTRHAAKLATYGTCWWPQRFRRRCPTGLPHSWEEDLLNDCCPCPIGRCLDGRSVFHRLGSTVGGSILTS